MANYTVNQKKKVVRVYGKSIDDLEYKQVERYNNLGYNIIMLEKNKPTRKNKHFKDDMIKYLEGNIDDELYVEMIDRMEKKQKFLVIKGWLSKALKERAEKQKKPYETIEEIINRAKSREEKAKQSKSKGKPNENASTSNENE